MSLVKSSTSAWHWREPFNERRSNPNTVPVCGSLTSSLPFMRSAHDKRFVFAAFTFREIGALQQVGPVLEGLGCWGTMHRSALG